MKHNRRLLYRFLRRYSKKQGAAVTPPPLEGTPKIKPLPMSYQSAAKGLVDFKAIKTVKYKNSKVKVETDFTHPRVVEFAKKLVKELEARGMPFYPFEYYRSHERQKVLKKQGVSRAGPGSSPHNFGMAVDIVHFGRYWDLTEREWAIVGMIGKEVARKMGLKVTWGGDWDFYDPAHWQLKDWKVLRQAVRDLPVRETTGHPLDDLLTAQRRVKLKV